MPQDRTLNKRTSGRLRDKIQETANAMSYWSEPVREEVEHKYFHLVNWETTYAMQTKPPWQPELKGSGDSSWFDNYPDSEDDFAVALEGQEQQQFKIFDDL